MIVKTNKERFILIIEEVSSLWLADSVAVIANRITLEALQLYHALEM